MYWGKYRENEERENGILALTLSTDLVLSLYPTNYHLNILNELLTEKKTKIAN